MKLKTVPQMTVREMRTVRDFRASLHKVVVQMEGNLLQRMWLNLVEWRTPPSIFYPLDTAAVAAEGAESRGQHNLERIVDQRINRLLRERYPVSKLHEREDYGKIPWVRRPH